MAVRDIIVHYTQAVYDPEEPTKFIGVRMVQTTVALPQGMEDAIEVRAFYVRTVSPFGGFQPEDRPLMFRPEPIYGPGGF